ncbi:VOC family protein [Oceanibacterium hippocampi]|uniref:Glyoxalase-like domain protein n=1 Tax=Oceanibacterium hippocampi TaxID=745714 RepID=A0A1Y5RQ55_9PROT|nr:VOC family protein [Oceanibacterium hippocampi]SLN22727.1 Glyoxalase-like domain protein [Oceanibacterium hippocampi]
MTTLDVFHLAIPTHDLDATEAFYTNVVGATRARRYDDRVTFRFFEHQVVCHLDPEFAPAADLDPFANIYPRHFGLTFRNGDDFDAFHERCARSGWHWFRPWANRFGDLPERHRTFFLADPTGNLLEFKHYEAERYIY